jgi:hypothetical protein
MRSSFLSLARLSPIRLLTLLMLSTHILWAQKTSSLQESKILLPDAPAPLATVSEAQIRIHFPYNRLPLVFNPNQGHADSWMRFLPDHTGYDSLPVNSSAVLGQDARTFKFGDKDRYFIGSAPTQCMTFAPTCGHVHHETIHGNDLEYYGRHIPWAGPVVLRIGQQAKVHPHITTVLKMVRPQF